MKYLYLLTSLVVIFVSGFLFKDLDGIYWYLSKSTLSAAAVLAAVNFRTRVSTAIAILETFFVIVTFLASFSYLTGHKSLYYDHYITILTCVCFAEAALLIVGVPYSGIRRAVSHVHDTRLNRSPVRGMLNVSDSKGLS